MQSLFDHIPVGVGSKGIIPMGARDLEEALEMGMDWSLREGYAWAEDKVNPIGRGTACQIPCTVTIIAISIFRSTVRSMDVCYKLTQPRSHHVLRREAYLKLVNSATHFHFHLVLRACVFVVAGNIGSREPLC